MSDIIHLLPDSVANQIAAGEVIQRPASVIKELVENAVDAGAKNISVIIKDAGRTLIQVIDDGRGMTETDARMAFERHATSKISKAEDLFTLATMGFRGEALPSICAISQLELRTKTRDDRLGTILKINCSRVESQEPGVCPDGTNIMVRNIFCNLPARRKFLKSDSVELANIMREFERLALVNNHLHLSIDTGSKMLDLRPGTFKQRIADIWKNNLNLQLLPIEVDTSLVKISGYISRPEFARRRGALQYLIANGRNMRHPYFHKAILMCYKDLIAADAQPCYFIKFEVDPSTIDVNIHPTKNEIKFENESEIWSILTAAVRNALGKFAAVPSIDFDVDQLPQKRIEPGEFVDAPTVKVDPAYNPFNNSRREHVPSDWNKLYSDFMAGASKGPASTHPAKPEPDLFEASEVAAPSCLQYGRKYIIRPSERGLMLIDQHRAHVRILYEQFLAKTGHDDATQMIMFPREFSLDPSQQIVLEGIGNELRRLGIIVEPSDAGKWKIVGVPPSLKGSDPAEVIIRIIDSVSDDSNTYGNEADPAEALTRRAALIMARSAAITKGVSLSADEMEYMVTELFKCQSPELTPNGNPIVKIIDDDRIRALFDH